MAIPLPSENQLSLPPELPAVLVSWYRQNARPLPWRANREPYRVWVSEVMLQQTRAEAVIPYYNRFLAALPSVEALAAAADDRLMKLWEGLGYYSRARNLKKAAQKILTDHAGVFPSDPAEIAALPGVGPYTVGAISSICYGYPIPAVDGNVLRVVSRLTGSDSDILDPKTKAAITNALVKIYPEDTAGDFTQSLMELGATLCLPAGTVRCGSCPVSQLCTANRLGITHKLPVRRKAPTKQEADISVFILLANNRVAIRKREASGLLSGLWEFPNLPGKLTPQLAMEAAETLGVRPTAFLRQVGKTHTFTHIKWHMRGCYITCESPADSLVWATRSKLETTYSLPTAFRKFLEDMDSYI